MPKSCPTEPVAGRPRDKEKQKQKGRKVRDPGRWKDRGRKRILEK